MGGVPDENKKQSLSLLVLNDTRSYGIVFKAKKDQKRTPLPIPSSFS